MTILTSNTKFNPTNTNPQLTAVNLMLQIKVKVFTAQKKLIA